MGNMLALLVLASVVLASLASGLFTSARRDVELGAGLGVYTATGEWVLNKVGRLSREELDELAQRPERHLQDAERDQAINLAPQGGEWDAATLFWFVEYGILGRLGGKAIANATNLNKNTVNTRSTAARNVLDMHRERLEEEARASAWWKWLVVLWLAVLTHKYIS